MVAYLTPKIALLSALNFIIAVVILFFEDVGLYYFINYIVIDILNWFNDLSFFFKIFLLLVGAGTLFYFLLEITQFLTAIITRLIFFFFPLNWFTLISTAIIAIGNAILCIIWLWRIPSHFNFWVD